jgi:hypothetical protein
MKNIKIYIQQLGVVIVRFLAVLLALALVIAALSAGVVIAVEYLLPPAP